MHNDNPNNLHHLGEFTPTHVFQDRAPATVRIADSSVASGFVLINADDFDPATMTEYVGE